MTPTLNIIPLDKSRLFNKIKYLITEKGDNKYSKERSDFLSDLSKKGLKLEDILNLKGENLHMDVIDKRIWDFVEQEFNYINETFTKHSRLSKYLDENGECKGSNDETKKDIVTFNKIKYLKTNNVEHKYSKQRSDFLNDLSNIGLVFDDITDSKDKEKSMALIDEKIWFFLEKAPEQINELFTKHSDISKHLDENSECNTLPYKKKPQIGLLDGSYNYIKEEIERMKKQAPVARKRFSDNFLRDKGINPADEVAYVNWYIKDQMYLHGKDYIKELHNISKSESSSKTKKTKTKTKIGDIEMLPNYHLEYGKDGIINDGHMHFITHMFCPTTGLYLSPKGGNYGNLFQKAHHVIELKYKVLEQGVALGMHKEESLTQKKKLNAYHNKYFKLNANQRDEIYLKTLQEVFPTIKIEDIADKEKIDKIISNYQSNNNKNKEFFISESKKSAIREVCSAELSETDVENIVNVLFEKNSDMTKKRKIKDLKVLLPDLAFYQIEQLLKSNDQFEKINKEGVIYLISVIDQRIEDCKKENLNKHTKKHLNDIGDKIEHVFSIPSIDFEERKAMLIKSGIQLTTTKVKHKSVVDEKIINRDSEQYFEFKELATGLCFNNDCFSGNHRYAIKKFGRNFVKRIEVDRTVSNKKPEFGLDKVEFVLTDKLNRSKQWIDYEIKANRLIVKEGDTIEMIEYKKNRIKEIKIDGFKLFHQSCLESGGIIVDLNKQEHLSYWKIDKNNKGNTTHKKVKYNSSSMINEDLKGANIASYFDLDKQDIISYQNNEFMQSFPKNHSRYKVSFINLDEKFVPLHMNIEEYYLLKEIERKLQAKKLEILFDEFNKSYTLWSNKTHRPLIQFEQKSDGSQTIIFNDLRPWEAAEALLTMEMQSIRNAEPGTVWKYSSSDGISEDLRHFYVKAAMSKDKMVREHFVIEGFDEKTVVLLDDQVNREIARCEGNFTSNIDKSIEKGKYSFSNANAMLHLIDNDWISDKNKDNIREVLNKQIGVLLKKGVYNLSSNQFDLDKYIEENRSDIEKHTEMSKDQIEQYIKSSNKNKKPFKKIKL